MQLTVATFVKQVVGRIDKDDTFFIIADGIASFTVENFFVNNREVLDQSKLVDGVVYLGAEATLEKVQMMYKGYFLNLLSKFAPNLLMP